MDVNVLSSLNKVSLLSFYITLKQPYQIANFVYGKWRVTECLSWPFKNDNLVKQPTSLSP